MDLTAAPLPSVFNVKEQHEQSSKYLLLCNMEEVMRVWSNMTVNKSTQYEPF